MTNECIDRVTLSSLLRTLDRFLSIYHLQRIEQDTNRQNKYQLHLGPLDEIVGELDEILFDRCCYIYKRGRKKDTKCLRARLRTKEQNKEKVVYLSDKCKSHILKPKDSNVLESKPPKLHKMNNKKMQSKNCKPPNTPTNSKPNEPLQKYYSNPEKELRHIYNNIYLDRDNVVVIKPSDIAQNYNWILVCKYRPGSKVLTKFSETMIVELVKQMTFNKYDYIVDETDEYFDQINVAKVQATLNSEERPLTIIPKDTGDHSTSKLFSQQSEKNPADKFKGYYRGEKIQPNKEPLMTSEEFERFNASFSLINKQPSKENSLSCNSEESGCSPEYLDWERETYDRLTRETFDTTLEIVSEEFEY